MTDGRHTNVRYGKELHDVKESLLYMGAITEQAIEKSMRSLLDRNSELAREVMANDDLIDRLDVENEEKCVRLLALRQPAARDLRFVTTAIKINGHLERIGDMAANIAERAVILNELPLLKPYIDLPKMDIIARTMIRESLDAFVNEDVELARKVKSDDEVIDQMNEQIFRELLTFMMEDPKKIHTSLMIIQVSKNLERISDHATGIADMVIYMITGESVRHQPLI